MLVFIQMIIMDPVFFLFLLLLPVLNNGQILLVPFLPSVLLPIAELKLAEHHHPSSACLTHNFHFLIKY